DHRGVCQPQTAKHKPDYLMQQFLAAHLVINYRLLRQMMDSDHGRQMMRKSHPVLPADGAFENIAGLLSGNEAGLDLPEAARESILEQDTGEFAIFEATVQDHPMLDLPGNCVTRFPH